MGEPSVRPHPAEPEALPIAIRHLDADLVVVAKPAGMATHPGPGWWRGSLVNGLLHHVRDWPGVGGVAGPGIVHRLDVHTSGLLVVARTDRAHKALLAAAAAHELERVYLAWVDGLVREPGTISAPLGRDDVEPQRVIVRPDGKVAVTHFRPLSWQAGRTLLRVVLETGRTHQIRVHMAHLGHPVVGDPRYGKPGAVMALHAWMLAFVHPVTGQRLQLVEPPPGAWEAFGALPREV
jgi:23S rRNA pseudouridine1911/1915/1917 synthase